eukprot:TRINITY_DN721_c2_g1_i1.p1 TRINITY_DN721_c2_g1~~TRINITY_DN721_c2_g1_i1.p1  ORF type:complete len:266 (+),score=57.47 TRINITY_DN721_c2_g1_i1:80-799(+)
MNIIKVFEGAPVLGKDEALMGKWAGLQLCFAKNIVGNGVLYITGKRFVWVRDGQAVGYECHWEDLMMHAVCSDVNEFAAPHLFCMLDREILNGGAKDEMSATHETTNDVRIIPMSAECHDLLDELFTVFSNAASMTDTDAAAFQGQVVKEGDFNPKKRKFCEADDESPAEPYTQITALEGLPGADFFGIPGEALTEEEREQKLAEWDSKLIIQEGPEEEGEEEEEEEGADSGYRPRGVM